jgi:DNA-nicking Smr family endonuclease
MKNKNLKDEKKKISQPVLQPDDEELFLSVMKGVQRQSEGEKQHHYAELPDSKTILSRNPDLARGSPLIEPKQKEAPLGVGRSADLDRRTLERLRRGHLRPEARLDLHGMTREQAYSSLMSFLELSQARGKRCVIVITGRGRTRDGGGILRKETPGWLNSSVVRSRVLAFATAKPRDGGVGALYVLLRRAR